MRKVIFMVIVLLTLIGTTSATTYYVNSADGNDADANGHTAPTNAMKTIAHFLTLVADGDTLRCMYGTNGIYAEAIALTNANSNAKDFTIRDNGDGVITIQPTGAAYLITTANAAATKTATFQNLTFDLSQTTWLYDVYLAGQKSVSFINCNSIKKAGSVTIMAITGTGTKSRVITVKDCNLNSTAWGLSVTDGNFSVNSSNINYDSYYAVYYDGNGVGGTLEVNECNTLGNDHAFVIAGTTVGSPNISVQKSTFNGSGTSFGFIVNPGAGADLGNVVVNDNIVNGVAGCNSYFFSTTNSPDMIGNVTVKRNVGHNMKGGVAVGEFASNTDISDNVIDINQPVTAAVGIYVGGEVTGSAGWTITADTCSVVTKVGAFGGTIYPTRNMYFAVVSGPNAVAGNSYRILSVDSNDQITLDSNATNGRTVTAGVCQLSESLKPVGEISITDNTIRFVGAARAHGIFAGLGTKGVDILRNDINNADYGIVCKDDYQRVLYNIVHGTTVLGIYFSGSDNCLAQRNTCIAKTGGAFGINTHQTKATANYNRIIDNILYAPSGATCLSMTGGVWDAYIDRNCYWFEPGGSLASTDETITTLAGLRAEWLVYGTPLNFYGATNDSNSMLANPKFINLSEDNVNLLAGSPCYKAASDGETIGAKSLNYAVKGAN